MTWQKAINIKNDKGLNILRAGIRIDPSDDIFRVCFYITRGHLCYRWWIEFQFAFLTKKIYLFVGIKQKR